jgi:hypothetical protein
MIRYVIERLELEAGGGAAAAKKSSRAGGSHNNSVRWMDGWMDAVVTHTIANTILAIH